MSGLRFWRRREAIPVSELGRGSRVRFALDLDNPARSFATGTCDGSLSLGFSDDSATTKKSDKTTPNTSYTSGAGH